MKASNLVTLYNQAQPPEIDYESLFFKLWLCLLGWVGNHSNIKENDRKIIDNLKSSKKFYDLFIKVKIDSSQFTWLAINLRNSPMKNGRGDLIDFSAVEFKDELIYEPERNFWFGHDFENGNSFYFSKDYKKNLEIFVEVLYQIRCDLFHGEYHEDHNYTKYYNLRYAYNILNEMLKKVI